MAGPSPARCEPPNPVRPGREQPSGGSRRCRGSARTGLQTGFSRAEERDPPPMSYQVIARKYRPQTFEEVVGQRPIIQTLENAVEQRRLHHAYLFSGPRGCGKTTVARLLAKALNCEK